MEKVAWRWRLIAAGLLLAAGGCPRLVTPSGDARQEELEQRKEALRLQGYGPESDGLMLRAGFSAPQPAYRPGAPVAFEVRLRNVALQDRELPLGSRAAINGARGAPARLAPILHFDVRVRNLAGGEPPRLCGWKLAQRDLGPLLVRVDTPFRRTLIPFEEAVLELELADFHALLVAGDYEVTIEYFAQPHQRGRGARSQPLLLKIREPGASPPAVSPTPPAAPAATAPPVSPAPAGEDAAPPPVPE